MRLRGEGLTHWALTQTNATLAGISCLRPVTGKVADLVARAYLAGANDALYDELQRQQRINKELVGERQKLLGIPEKW